MAAIILPRRWQQQPTGPVEIDWRNPLTFGLAHCHLGGEAYHINLVTQAQMGTRYGHMVTQGRPQGLATSGNNLSYVLNTVNVPTSLPISIGVVAGARPGASSPILGVYKAGTASSAFASITNGTGQAYPQYRIDADAGVSIADTDPSSSLVNTSRPYVCRSLSGTDHALIVGRRITSDTTSSNLVVSGATVGLGRVVRSNGSATTINSNAWFLLAAMWYRGLSDAEAFEFNAAPFQILVPRRVVKYFDAGGSSITGTISATWENFTSSITGTTASIGTLSQTLSNFTSSIDGYPVTTGTVTQTLEDYTSSISGSIGSAISGTTSVTLENFTQSAQGTTTVVGTTAVNLNDFTSAITGTTTVIGTSNITLDPFIMTANGYPGDAALIRIRTLVGAGE